MDSVQTRWVLGFVVVGTALAALGPLMGNGFQWPDAVSALGAGVLAGGAYLKDPRAHLGRDTRKAAR